MITSFRSKALKLFAATGNASKLPVQNPDRVARILQLLNAATTPEGMNIAGFGFHGLQGEPKRYAVKASANYRVTFGWDVADAVAVDLEDYH